MRNICEMDESIGKCAICDVANSYQKNFRIIQTWNNNSVNLNINVYLS